MTPDQVFSVVLYVVLTIALAVTIGCGAVLLLILKDTGAFARVGRFVRRQPKNCPDCGSFTEKRRRSWACSTIPSYLGSTGRCHKLFQATPMHASTTFSPFTYPPITPTYGSMGYIGPDGMCSQHTNIDLNCRVCRHILSLNGIDIS